MIAKKSSEKMKCVVMWLNMCYFIIERHQIRVWARWALTPVKLRTL